MRGCLVAMAWIAAVIILLGIAGSLEREVTNRFIDGGMLCTEYADQSVECEVLP